MSSTRPQRRFPGLIVGVAALAVGIFLIAAPFASVPVLAIAVAAGLLLVGLGDLIGVGLPARERRLPRLAATVCLVAGALLLVWPGVTVWVIAVAAGAALIISGVLLVISGLRAIPRRIDRTLLGIASALLGGVAWSWPAITVFVVAIVIGIRVAWFGVVHVLRSLRGTDRHRDEPGVSGGRRHLVVAVAALIGAALLAAAGIWVQASSPRPDGFYAADGDLPAEPGRLLAAEPFHRDVPDGAQAWRIRYDTTTRGEGRPAVATALVVAPVAPPAGPRPVIAWAHGTTGVAQGCAPSLLPHPFEAGVTPGLSEVIDRGWVMVATDYTGLGTEGPNPYLIGEGEGRAVLDSVRAARELTEVTLSDQTAVWGHSQGGHAALWTGILAPDYAPDVRWSAWPRWHRPVICRRWPRRCPG